MRIGGQLTLLNGAGKDHLFKSDLLQKYLDSHRPTRIPFMRENATRIENWLQSLSNTEATEITLESKFLNEIFCGILGYSLFPSIQSVSSSIYQKPSSQIIRINRTPDAILGTFTDELCFIAVLELKTPGTNLDAPQPRKNNETPVEQGFYYGKRILGVRWVIVSDMRLIRLYSVESDGEYEEIKLDDCTINFDGNPSEAYKRLHFLFHHDYLIKEHEQSQVSRLYQKSATQQLEIRDSFYQAYYDIRTDLYHAIKEAVSTYDQQPSRLKLLEATQRLLDRLVFIYFCEDHPQQLIPRNTIKNVCEAARFLPGSNNYKVYEALKNLFHEVDTGSPIGNKIRIPGYNGELFKEHPILDHINLPDKLHDKMYTVDESRGRQRKIKGIWGLYEYDFWTELNEHLLGHIFEQSLSDLGDIGVVNVRSADKRLEERKRGGIYYTTHILSDFLSNSSIQTLLDEIAPITDSSEIENSLNQRLAYLYDMKIADFTCGSGAFLVSAYHEMLREYWRLRSSIYRMKHTSQVLPDLFESADTFNQASLLRQCLYGVDKLPQAVEIAKLALWLSSARKDEKVADLGGNIIDADSLAFSSVMQKLCISQGSLDIVIGNPPWGGQIDQDAFVEALELLHISDQENFDTWELFLLLGLYALREGGRLALVIPDSFFYSEKEKTRKRLLSMATIEKIHNLGADWFGPQVRMGTVIIQARRGNVQRDKNILCSVLAGDLRRQAIHGQVPITQVETQTGHDVPMARALDSPVADFQVFRGINDDRIIECMNANSIGLGEMCERARGEEINKAGMLWVCPGCSGITTPGKKLKGGGYDSKPCPKCAYRLTQTDVQTATLIEDIPGMSSSTASYIDGIDISRRYQEVIPTKKIRKDVQGWTYKPDSLYISPKILIRQAGVGIVAILDQSNAYCPQSIYIYRLKEEYAQEGYSHEYILAALLSRTMTYYIFKRYGEVDPAKAHSKLTHDRLHSLPIPKLNFASEPDRIIHSGIVRDVRKMLEGTATLGGTVDNAIELNVRQLWRISVEEGAYINGQFYGLENSQVVRDLFPEGPPKPQEIAIR